LNVIDEMGTGIMFCPFLLVASMAGDRFCVDPCTFGLKMTLDIDNIPMATIAREGSVNRLSEFPLIDLAVASQTLGVVDTLVAKISPLGWSRLSFLA